MKKIYLMALAVFFGASMMAQVSVTFQVDMSDQTVSGDGVHVAGDWQDEAGFASDWDPSSAQLTDIGNGIYSLTVTLSTVGQYEYKFVNGNNWDNPEDIPVICQKGGGNSNRVFNVNAWHADVANLPNGFVLPAVMFGGSAPAGQVAIRLQVNMVNQLPISDLGVHVAGDFTDPIWVPQDALMFNSSDEKYAYVAAVNPDAAYAFKFLNGDFWDGSEESVPADCAVNDNRQVVVAQEDVTTESFCFGTCGLCAPQTEVTFKVDMNGAGGGSGDGVSVAGSFQGWSAGATLLSDDDGDGIYELSMMMDQGSIQYKFVNGGDWETVPGECSVDNNRTLEIGTEAVTAAYCFNQCTTECIPDPEPSDITFRVNMADETVAAEGVWIMGGFTTPQWQSGAVQMTDDDADGVYEVTIENISGPSEIQYKFANGDPNSVEESGDFLAGGCGGSNGIGGFNRTYLRTAADAVLDVVCYNSCSDCSVGIDEAKLGKVSIYPNPTTGISFITIENPNKYNLQMSIVDITGKIVRGNTSINSSRFELNTTDLNSGLYFLNIVNAQNDRAVYKLMVQ